MTLKTTLETLGSLVNTAYSLIGSPAGPSPKVLPDSGMGECPVLENPGMGECRVPTADDIATCAPGSETLSDKLTRLAEQALKNKQVQDGLTRVGILALGAIAFQANFAKHSAKTVAQLTTDLNKLVIGLEKTSKLTTKDEMAFILAITEDDQGKLMPVTIEALRKLSVVKFEEFAKQSAQVRLSYAAQVFDANRAKLVDGFGNGEAVLGLADSVKQQATAAVVDVAASTAGQTVKDVLPASVNANLANTIAGAASDSVNGLKTEGATSSYAGMISGMVGGLTTGVTSRLSGLNPFGAKAEEKKADDSIKAEKKVMVDGDSAKAVTATATTAALSAAEPTATTDTATITATATDAAAGAAKNAGTDGYLNSWATYLGKKVDAAYSYVPSNPLAAKAEDKKDEKKEDKKVEDKKEEVNPEAPSTASTIISTLDSAAITAGKTVDEAHQATTDVTNAIVDTVKNTATAVVTAADAAATTAGQTVDNVYKAQTDAANAIAETVKNTATAVVTAADTAATTAGQKVDETHQATTGATNTIGDKVKNAASAVVTAVDDALKIAGKKVDELYTATTGNTLPKKDEEKKSPRLASVATKAMLVNRFANNLKARTIESLAEKLLAKMEKEDRQAKQLEADRQAKQAEANLRAQQEQAARESAELLAKQEADRQKAIQEKADRELAERLQKEEIERNARAERQRKIDQERAEQEQREQELRNRRQQLNNNNNVPPVIHSDAGNAANGQPSMTATTVIGNGGPSYITTPNGNVVTRVRKAHR